MKYEESFNPSLEIQRIDGGILYVDVDRFNPSLEIPHRGA